MKILQAFGNAERRHFDGGKVQNAKRLSTDEVRNDINDLYEIMISGLKKGW